MKIWRPISIIGTVIFVFGVIFYLQSQSIVGPETSFMYANPEWEINGIQIAIVGILTGFSGLGLKFIKKS